MPSSLKELIEASDESTEKIIRSLLNDENIELKTELQQPIILTKLLILGEWYENEGVEGAKELCENFADIYMHLQVSKDRKSRIEIKEILSEAMARERGLGERLEKPT